MAGTPETGEVYLLQRDSAAGKRQGRYVLGELLGRGGMAEVFAGQSLGSHGFQKPVAIKRLLPELANDTVFVERLIGEAKLLVGMQHGNIVSVLDLARDGDDVFLVMEFMDGPSVRQLLKARGQRGLPIGVATYIVQNAATGLEFAHGRPGGAVIHADISPSNILLTTSGEVRVADFGIARREGNAGGIVEGKWAYMAPEQARGEGLTPRSDVFALGVVLYELITGQHPLGRQVTADEREAAPVAIVPPKIVRPSIPSGIDKLVMKALAHDPRERFSRMQQFIDALVEERFAAGWREGANDLATVIREVAPGSAGSASAGPKTMHTDRPVTIVTRSLISQPQARPPSQPPVIHASPAMPGGAAPPYGGSIELSHEPPRTLDSGAQTRMVVIAPPNSGAELIVPVALPVAPTQMLPAAMPQPPMAALAAMLPAPELASIHGGNTFTGSSAAIDTGGSSRWTYGVLGAAALAGAIAAVVLGTKHDDEIIAVTPPPVEQPAPQKVEPPTPAPVVAPKVDPPAPVVADTAKTDPPKADPPKADPPKTDPPKADPAKTDSSLESKLAARRVAAAKTPTPPSGKTSSKKGDAVLQVDEWNGEYANIAVAGQSHDTPGAKFYLAAGTYTLIVSNDDQKFPCHVTLDSGKTTRVHVSLEKRTCD